MASGQRIAPAAGALRTEVIERLFRGSIDMHCHFGPDPTFERRTDAYELVMKAQEMGMGGLVLKSHDYPTPPLAKNLQRFAPNVALIGSVTLDEEMGGLNPKAVEASAKMGAKVVWMPTLTSENDKRKLGRPGPGVTLFRDFDKDKKLLPVVGEILGLIKHNNMVLATGHLSAEETFALVDEALKVGIRKIIITHAMMTVVGSGLTIEQQKQMAQKGAFIEHCYVGCMPTFRYYEPKVIAEAVKTVGAEHCILSTDLGQAPNPPPPEGMRMLISAMLLSGLSEEEIELTVKRNPAQLLGL